MIQVITTSTKQDGKHEHLVNLKKPIEVGDQIIFSNKIITIESEEEICPALQERSRGVVIGTTNKKFHKKY